MALDELYQEIILDHYKQPRNQGTMSDADVKLLGKNPLCGDEIEIFIKLKDNVVDKVAFQGSGCAISQASASVMTEMIKGKTLEEARELVETFSTMVKGEGLPEGMDDMDDMAAFRGVSEFPTRVKCALLAWKTFLQAIQEKSECDECQTHKE
jgi:nitrogen fixation NifU-like protein